MPLSPEFGLDGRKIVYDEDGKPCRSCNTLVDFQFAMGKSPASQKKAPISNSRTIATTYAKDEPPDVEKIGESGWTILHSMAAKYPENPTPQDQRDMHQFLTLWSKFYPCWWCAKDLASYMGTNEPELVTQDSFGRWLCGLHNKVNVNLGKPRFNCNLWKQRWKDGWNSE